MKMRHNIEMQVVRPNRLRPLIGQFRTARATARAGIRAYYRNLPSLLAKKLVMRNYQLNQLKYVEIPRLRKAILRAGASQLNKRIPRPRRIYPRMAGVRYGPIGRFRR